MRKIKDLDCILLIEDNAATLFLYQIIIKNLKLDVVVQETNNGKEAIEFLTCIEKFKDQKEYPKPGLIFLDINMPVMNGWDFLKAYDELSSDQKDNAIIIMFSSGIMEEYDERLKSSPSLTEIIKKPLRVETLNRILEEYFVPKDLQKLD